MFRNNVGALQDREGNWIHYGVGGRGGGDLIGWHQVTIGPEHVGMTLALYAEIEVKSLRGRLTKDQVKRQKMVERAGGICGVARSPEEAAEILLSVDRM